MSKPLNSVSLALWMIHREEDSYPEVSVSLPVTGSSAGTIGQPRG
jgi:hypothetical protein